jgi:hypothetical protein
MLEALGIGFGHTPGDQQSWVIIDTYIARILLY